MANKVEIKNRIVEFAKNNTAAMDRVLNRMALDILTMSKAQVPYKTSLLQQSGKYGKKSPLLYEVFYNKIYAAYQEFGMRKDGTHVVKNYTTPGTKKFYLRDPAQLITSRILNYIKQEVGKI